MKKNMNIPESLVRQLADFERKLKIVETAVTILGGLCGLLLTYGLLFFSDRFWDTPPILRGVLTFAGTITAAYFSYRWLTHWWWKRRDSRVLARMVQKHYRKLGDRLLGAVELADGSDLPDNISPALCQAAIRQVTDEAAKYDFPRAVETRGIKRYSLFFIGVAGLVLLLFAFFPQAGINAVKRWFQPFSPVERYTFVSIEDLPSEMVVPHGEDFLIACKLKKTSRWRPQTASCAIKGQPKIQSSVSKGMAEFAIPGQTRQEIVNIRIGDITRNMKIIPVHRPELVELHAKVKYPDYLQRSETTNRLETADAEFLKACTVSFSGRISREIMSAELISESKGKTESAPLMNSGDMFTSDQLKIDTLDSLAFTWKDSLKMLCSDPYRLTITKVDDEAPLVKCSGIGRAVAILEEEVLHIDIESEDDYGIKEMWVNWSCLESRKVDASDLNGTENIKKGSPHTTSLKGKYTFSPIVAHVPEETMISLCAYAADYKPDRKPSMSLVYRIYVLSKAQHAKLLQDQMEAAQARIEDVIREEEDNLHSNTELSKQDPEKMASAETSEKLKSNKFTEKSNAAKLDNIAEDIKDILKEALRNKDIPEKTLAEWAQMSESMSKVANNQMQKAQKSLSQAQSSSQNRKENTEDAMASEQEAIDELKKIEQNIDSSINSMVAQNFINRLRAAATAEFGIADSYEAILPEMIGMSIDMLSDENRKNLGLYSLNQKETRKRVQYIQDDLAGFYNRTRIEVYDTIHTEMTETNVVGNLTKLTKLIEDNIGMKAIAGARAWGKQLEAWADYLEDNADDSQQGQGEPQMLSPEDMELLIALMRARQIEETLREQTRILDEGHRKNRSYKSDSRKLADSQNELARDIRPLERKAKEPKLRRFIEKIGGEMMNAGMFLRKPQTDSETVAIETEIIELLAQSIKSASGQAGSMGQMMMQAMMPGMMPGSGSLAGGTTDKQNANIDGTGDGENPDARNVDKAGGIDTTTLPAEFRNVLEEYFKALEENK